MHIYFKTSHIFNTPPRLMPCNEMRVERLKDLQLISRREDLLFDFLTEGEI